MVSFLKKAVQLLFFIYAALVFSVLMFVVFFLSLFASLCLPSPKDGNFIYTVLRYWARVWMFCLGIRYRLQGYQKENVYRPSVFVANHQSYLDIPMIVACLHQPVRILGMAEIAKVPIFGFIYRKAVILVNRSSKLDRAKSYIEMDHYLQNGISILIFPEGGFNKTNECMGDFFDGAFKLAHKSNTPIAPIVICDTKKILPEGKLEIHPAVSRAIYLSELHPKDYSDIQSLKIATRQKMMQAFNCSHEKR